MGNDALTAAIGTRLKISDPRPSHCSACFRGADATITFVDFDAAADRGLLTNEQGWVLDSLDDLHLCEPCVRAGAELLALKPEVQTAQAREIRRLETAVEHWQKYAMDLEATVAERPDEQQARRPRRLTTATAKATA